jgi:hypothetical protein
MKKLLNRVVLVLPYARRLRAERLHGGGTVNKHELVSAFAIATVALLGLLLGTSIAASVPKANCGPHDRTESGLQGETTQEERFSGDSELGYNCNLELVGKEPQGVLKEHIRRMDRRTPVTAPTMERTMLLLCSSTSASG